MYRRNKFKIKKFLNIKNILLPTKGNIPFMAFEVPTLNYSHSSSLLDEKPAPIDVFKQKHT